MFFLYFFGLTDVGLLGPDEPRYAAVGREMALSGDWVTPRLWGTPWFEKPALLYWMIAAANRAGLGMDLAPRLPVVLLSVVFLCSYYLLLQAEFGRKPALYASIILGASAMWLAFSQLGLTDLPMAAFFSLAMLCGLRWQSTGKHRYLTVAGFLVGMSVLAKGLVPLVLVMPFVWFSRKRWRSLLQPGPAFAFFVTATPWYLLCAWRNGWEFLYEFFFRHHVERFTTQALLHSQPFWFYVPVFFAALFPWTPTVIPLFQKSFYNDTRRRFLLVWVIFGLVFFSVSINKLPGYVLPLLPAAAALAGIALDEVRDARLMLASACLLLLLVPVVAASLPGILVAGGLRRAQILGWNWFFAITYLALAAVIWLWEEAGRRLSAVALVLFAVVFGVIYIKIQCYPVLDREASARWLWQRVGHLPAMACIENLERSWTYGLNYYAGARVPDCLTTPMPFRIRQQPGRPPSLD
jgi:4-amino-4-deoxy-L-arabinose transferase-like glycosyltransferase